MFQPKALQHVDLYYKNISFGNMAYVKPSVENCLNKDFSKKKIFLGKEKKFLEKLNPEKLKNLHWRQMPRK